MCAQSSFADQGPQHGFAGHLHEVQARLAETYPFAEHIADVEALADQLVETDIPGGDVTPALGGGQLDAGPDG